MAASPAVDEAQASSHQRKRSGALAEIGYNSIIADSDIGTTSEEESNGAQNLQLPAGDVQSVIGFSIGHEQARLASAQTPAAEKAAALGDLNGFFDGNQDLITDTGLTEEPEESERPQNQRLEKESISPPPRGRRAHFNEPNDQTSRTEGLPSPWRSTPRTFQRSDTTKAAMNELNESKRRRASSGPIEYATGSIRKLLPSIPSFPKSPSFFNFSIPNFPTSLPFGFGHYNEQEAKPIDDRDSRNSSTTAHSTVSRQSGGTTQSTRSDLPKSRSTLGTPSSSHETITTPVPGQNQTQQILKPRRPNQLLRRTTSDDSLLLRRQVSRVSSLGDDSRFEHVSEQVNSRLRAIKDSFQDSNLRLPNISISNFSFGSRQDGSNPMPTGEYSNAAKPRNNRPKSLSLTSAPLSISKNIDSNPPNITPEPPKTGGGMTVANAAAHPFFTRALAELEGDIVILGGYRGSVLRSAEAPYRQLWVPIKVGLNLRKVDLQVGLDPEDEENMEERIIPGGMLTHIGPVDIARRLFKRLRASDNARQGKLRIWDYGYDWRLSPHILSKKLIDFLEKLPSNAQGLPKEKRGAVVVAHSLGGLLARHAINQRPELFAGVVYAGVPTTCVNILGPLRNGDDVLFSSRVLTAQVNFSIRTSFALLPLDGQCFIDKDTKEKYVVDFFDPQTWADYHLTPVLAPPLPPLASTSSGPIEGILGSMGQALANVSLPLRRTSVSRRQSPRNSISHTQPPTTATTSDSTVVSHHTHQHHQHSGDRNANATANTTGMTPQMNNNAPHNSHLSPHHHPIDSSSPSAPTKLSAPTSPAITFPRDAAFTYLSRTLASTKLFKQQLDHHPPHSASNSYPPAAVIFGKATPTVYGARVSGREGIKHADAYDDLAFGSGDGVVLARAAMLPPGYQVVKGGLVSSERGHVTLLGDLEAVGRCLVAVLEGRRRGVGLGREEGEEGEVEKKEETNEGDLEDVAS
ncbi:MAG: hypothetical protein M1820_003562 [Bogoriella megaspora]|nr:MAG: hypothetical protein M1820_003562 [Bogoriella megaspora]